LHGSFFFFQITTFIFRARLPDYAAENLLLSHAKEGAHPRLTVPPGLRRFPPLFPLPPIQPNLAFFFRTDPPFSLSLFRQTPGPFGNFSLQPPFLICSGLSSPFFFRLGPDLLFSMVSAPPPWKITSFFPSFFLTGLFFAVFSLRRNIPFSVSFFSPFFVRVGIFPISYRSPFPSSASAPPPPPPLLHCGHRGGRAFAGFFSGPSPSGAKKTNH